MDVSKIDLIIVASALVTLILIVLLSVFVYSSIKKEQEVLLEKEQAAKEHQRELFQESIRITEATQKKIARELHDHMGATLSIALHHLEFLEGSKNFENYEKNSVNRVHEALDESMMSIRQMSRSLVSKTLENEGILEALEELVEFSSVKNRTIEFNHNNGVSFLNTRQELAIYRIAQEAINNAIKYAKSEIISVTLEIDGEDFKLLVSDNGIGFQWSEFRKSLGLSNMQIRAEEIGATLKIESEPEKGTKIILTSNEQYQSSNS